MALFSPRDFAVASQEAAEDPRPAQYSVLANQRIAPRGETYAIAGWGARDLVALKPATSPSATPVGGRTKRIFDIAVAGLALVLLSPVLAAIAVLIKWKCGGSVIYRHKRIGFGGRTFECLKFRTMVDDGDAILRRHLEKSPAAAEEWLRTRKLLRDPRITGIGFLLRKTSLDELPQLLNILAGDMSCVGPRPIVADELKLYGAKSNEYLQARPGVTGLWQVCGRSQTTYEMRTDLDARYVREWSMSKDLLILLLTLPAVMKTHQAA